MFHKNTQNKLEIEVRFLLSLRKVETGENEWDTSNREDLRGRDESKTEKGFYTEVKGWIEKKKDI